MLYYKIKWLENLKGIRGKIREEIRDEIREEIRDEIRDEIQEKIQDEIQEKIQEKIQDEIQEEFLMGGGDEVAMSIVTSKSIDEAMSSRTKSNESNQERNDRWERTFEYFKEHPGGHVSGQPLSINYEPLNGKSGARYFAYFPKGWASSWMREDNNELENFLLELNVNTINDIEDIRIYSPTFAGDIVQKYYNSMRAH